MRYAGKSDQDCEHIFFMLVLLMTTDLLNICKKSKWKMKL